MSLHARISPSALKATKLCPGRVRANADAPQKTSASAAEGTMLHEIAADCIEQGFEPHDFIGQKRHVEGFDFVVDDDMADCMVAALDWLREQPGQMFVESRVALDPYMPGMFGTLDIGILHSTTSKISLTIYDWKFGVEIVVPIINNYQLRAYALGFIETHLKPIGVVPDEIHLIIEQPRAFKKAARFSEPWTISYAELLPFGEEMSAIMQAAEQPDAPRIAGKEQCRFCALAYPGGCNSFDQFHLDLLGDDDEFDDLDDYSILTPARRTSLILHKSMIESWLSGIHGQALEAATNGNPPPGLKAIEGDQGDRKWTDVSNAERLLVTGEWIDQETGEIFTFDALGDDAFTRKVLTPPQVEKVAKKTRSKPGKPELWEKLQSLITRAPSKPQLVLESDPRPAIQPIENEFDDLP